MILFFAIVGGGTASFNAMGTMLNSEFSQPCYAGLWTPAAEESIEFINATEFVHYS